MKYYIIAGEASGDLHGSNLIQELKKLDDGAIIRAWGGDLMTTAGAQLVKHYRELAFMGFVEVIANLKTILKNIASCKNDIYAWKPDVVVLIDYPGFNLRIADYVKSLGIPVVYYISPQLWAWKEGRVKIIKRAVDKLLVILPFEVDYFKKLNYNAIFVGHPLIDAIANFQLTPSIQSHFSLAKKKLLLMPGSREQEIRAMLPTMVKVAQLLGPKYETIIAAAPSQSISSYNKYLENTNIRVLQNNTYNLLSEADLAFVTSGTATLETALFKVPQVVCYKGNALSYLIAKQIVKVKYISLVNLILDEPVVEELIQGDFTDKKLLQAALKLTDPQPLNQMLDKYQQLEVLCGGKGASLNAAKEIIAILK
ncbi:MAG: hypothetical protein RIQ89_2239 [Bacteroidota bacterium]|jgi:lipid-A-disaccharide synthase